MLETALASGRALRTVFYLPVVTPWWFTHIVIRLIRVMARDHEVHVLVPPLWRNTGIGPEQIDLIAELPHVFWHVLDGPDHTNLRGDAAQPDDLFALIDHINPDVTLCRSADIVSPQRFPGTVRYIMEAAAPPFVTQSQCIWLAPTLQPVSFLPASGDHAAMTSGAFAISLIYVSYAYTGWNAATYVSGELEHPQRDLPRVLILGTLTVMTLYVALNAVFLMVAPMDGMAGQLEVGVIAARAAFGPVGTHIAVIALAVLLISTVSAMTIAGPRVLQVIGEDLPALGALAVTNDDGVPSRAIFLQSGVALVFILTSSFEAVLVFSGFTLAAMSFATVLGLLVLRWREPELERPYRVGLFPIPPLIYLGLTGWTLVFVLIEKPMEALASLGLMALGAGVFFALRGAEKAE